MIYVDDLIAWPQKANTKQGERYFGNGKRSCHMSTDQDDLTELHEFAEKIGLRREWFQEHASMPHYDLTPTRRRLAVINGATAVSNTVFVQKCSRLLRKSNATKESTP